MYENHNYYDRIILVSSSFCLPAPEIASRCVVVHCEHKLLNNFFFFHFQPIRFVWRLPDLLMFLNRFILLIRLRQFRSATMRKLLENLHQSIQRLFIIWFFMLHWITYCFFLLHFTRETKETRFNFSLFRYILLIDSIVAILRF